MHDTNELEAGDALEALLRLDHPRKLEAAEWAGRRLSAPSSFDRDTWKAAADFGIQGLLSPRSHGGREDTIVNALLTFEGLSLGSPDSGFVFALAAQVFAMQRALNRFGSEAQLSRWLPRLVDGTAIGAFAVSEPGAGSDTGAISTTATRLEDGSYRLDGTKAWVTLGPVCDVVIVFATTDHTKGRWGLTAFVVDTTLAGVHRSEPVSKLGLETSPMGMIGFDGCIVGSDAVLASEGAGGAIFAEAVDAERAYLYVVQIGASERLLQTTIERSRRRRAFGVPIGRHQAVAHRIAEMKLRHESGRLLIYKAGILADRGEPVGLAAALAKLGTSESSVESALDALRIHGAEGYTTSSGVDVALRDAIGGLSFSGTSDIARTVVARLLRVGAGGKQP